MSQFQEQPLPISVPTVADLATARARTANGAVVQTTGRTTAGDGGAGAYIYRKTGRSGVTLNGFHIAGPGVDDYWENVDKLQANAIQWGCDRTGNADCSAALVAATAALPSGGAIVFPAGTYLITQTCTLAPVVFMPGARIKTSGTPVVTIDSYTATPTQWVFDTAGGGSVTITKKHPVTVEHWGAVGDGVTDDSARGQAAINATNNVELLAKTYRATWVVNPSSQAVSIKGRKTRLIAANNNEWGLTLTGAYPGGVCRISEIEFYHQQGSMQRHGLQIATGSAVFVDNCWFSYCGIGLCVNSAIELRFSHCWFRENYVGCLLTTRTAATGWYVNDIAGQQVPLSSDSIAIQHPTENSFVGMIFNSNRFGVIVDQPGNIWALAQDLLFDKAVFQYGNVGMLLIAPTPGQTTDNCVVVNSAWCESNYRNTINRFDGVDYGGGDYITNFGVLEINNGIVETVRASDQADVRLYACSINETSKFFKDDTASITCEMCYGYDVVIDQLTDVTFSIRSSFAALSKAYMPIGISYALANSDRLIHSYTCYAGDQPPVYLATNLGTFDGSVLPGNKCAAYRAGYLQGAYFPYTSTEDEKYSIKWSIRSHCPPRTFTVNASTDVFTSTAHGLANGMELNATTTGTLPAGMAINTPYFVMNATTDTFQLSAANNMRMRVITPGVDYDFRHTVIGGAMSGDFTLRWRMTDTFGLETSMVLGVCTETTPQSVNNYTVPDYAVQYINGTTMKLWKNGVESTHTVTWGDGDVIFTRTGSTISVEVDGTTVATATDASFTTATVYPIFTAASVATAEVLLYDRPTVTYGGELVQRTFESNGVAINVTDTGSGTHTLAQVANFNLMTANIDSGAIAGIRVFPVTSEWTTWQLHGPAGEGGQGAIMLSAASTTAVRDYQLCAVNVVSHANNAEMRDYAQSRCFYAFASASSETGETTTLSGDVVISSGASGANYDDLNTFIGPALTGDFTLEMELPSFNTNLVFGLKASSSITAGTNQYLNQDYGVQYLDGSTVREWRLGDLTAHSTTWTTGKIKLVRTGAKLELFVDDAEVTAAEETAFSTQPMFPTVSFIPNQNASLIFRNLSGTLNHLGSNLTLTQYDTLSRKEYQDEVAFSTSIRLDFDTRQGDNKYVELTDDTTITAVGTRAGIYTLIVRQDGVGSHGITWSGFVDAPAQPNQSADTLTVYKFYFDPPNNTFIDVS